ncbi:MAG: motility associated factor glycosyltransferase family protein [Spirochaetia bacterium]
MSFLEKNLRALGLTLPSKEAPPPLMDYEIVRSPSGCITARYGGKWLHSPRDPVRETARIAESAIDGTEGCFVVLGFGLGYMCEYLAEHFPDSRIIAAEADPGFFLKAAESRDMTRLFSSPRLKLLLGSDPSELTRLLKDSQHDIIRELPLRGMTAVHSEYYRQVHNILLRFISRMEVNRNTLKKFGRLWVRNLISNLPLLSCYRGVNELSGMFKGIPSLMIAAGPTLDNILPLLPELRKRLFITAVDTALGPCLKAGVEPDAVVVVDPQYWNTRHLDNLSLENAFLISESSTHPKVFRLGGKEKFFGSSLFPLGRWIEQRLGKFGELGAGGSVATSAWDFCKNIGTSPIFCAGMDLGFPDNRTHVKGSFFEERVHASSFRLIPAEQGTFRYLYSAHPYLTPSSVGGEVLTDKRMEVYRWWFSGQTSLPGSPPTFTISPGGVQIDGISTKTLPEVLKLPERRREIDTLLARAAVPLDPDEQKRKKKIVDEAAADLSLRLGRLADKAGEAKRIAETAEPGDPAGTFAELEKIDQVIQQDDTRDIAGFLMEDLLQELKGKAETAGEVLDTSRLLYERLHSACMYHRELLEQYTRDTV